jgi:hypothetical protein
MAGRRAAGKEVSVRLREPIEQKGTVNPGEGLSREPGIRIPLAATIQSGHEQVNRRDAMSAERKAIEGALTAVTFQWQILECLKLVRLCTAIFGFARRRRRINAETQRFAEERRERRKKMLFSSALLRALCVSALELV